MKTHKLVLWLTVVILFIGMAAGLSYLRGHQKLGKPGIKVTPNPGTVVVNIELPDNVLNYLSTNVSQAAVVTNFLPKDTSYAQRRYTNPDGFWINANVVLMGADRTSIHKPEYCLPGQGWHIERKTTADIPIAGPQPYTLHVAEWTLRIPMQMPDGTKEEVSGLYVFWFVADNEQTASHMERVRWLARDLLRKGVLQRWAYVSYFAVCRPGQEEAALKAVEQLIAASVPEFQLPLSSAAVVASGGGEAQRSEPSLSLTQP